MEKEKGNGRNTQRLMIANRSEIALRIIQSASLFPLPSPHKTSSQTHFETVSIHTPSEANALHVSSASKSIVLPGEGPSQYLNISSLISLAKKNQVSLIHPGYGLLSENAEFARKVIENGITWIGPTPEQLEILGEKTKARDLAKSLQVPLLPGTDPISSSKDLQSFFQTQPPNSRILLKAVSGGGGKGMRLLNSSQPLTELTGIFESASKEAKGAFGDERVYLELFLENARHVEVQLIGDGQNVQHLWERECSLQRNHQKLVEISPSPSISHPLREQVLEAALSIGREVRLKSLATVEFLVDEKLGRFYFMEVNPRIQVEHTVTEQVTGLDLVNLQLQIALGAKLADLGLLSPPRFPIFTSIQFRLNAETYSEDGTTSSEAGRMTEFHVPQGNGIRIDTAAHSPFLLGSKKVQYISNPAFDSLVAKIILTSPDYQTCLRLAGKTLSEIRIKGFKTNLSLLEALSQDESVITNKGIHTNYVLQNFARLLGQSKEIETARVKKEGSEVQNSGQSGDEEKIEKPSESSKAFRLPMAAVLTSALSEGDTFKKDQEIGIIEAMKMEHVLRSDKESGTIEKVLLKPGQFGSAGSILYYYRPSSSASSDSDQDDNAIKSGLQSSINVEEIRPELADLVKSKSYLTDDFRKKAVEKRHSRGYLTARENLSLLVDDVENSFIELGDLAVAAQRSRIDDQKLRETTSGDGVITGFGTINRGILQRQRDDSDSDPTRVALCIYDYLVLAATQGFFHHLKLDRIFQKVLDARCPLVLYAEGGGGRPGDVDVTTEVAGLKTPSFILLGQIRARGIPSIGVANGFNFAGNAALLGTVDLIVSTRGGHGQGSEESIGKTSIGMGGPAMIHHSAKLGEYKPEEIGPASVHSANGNIDILVESETEAAIAVKKLLSYFQGPVVINSNSNLTDQRVLRHLIPKDRKRAYDVKTIIETFADEGSFIELGAGYGKSLVTGFLRIRGKPLAIIASSVISPLGGAIDVSSALKATRFMNLLTRTKACHLMVAADTPGFMVGVEAEAAGPPGQVKAFGDWFAAAAGFQQAGGMVFAVTLRKAYGLGAQALLGGSTLSNFFSCSWPTGEFAGMGPEGAVKLGMKKELEAIENEEEREQLYKTMVEAVYERGKAGNTASMLEIDTVIDPADTRKWLVNGLNIVQPLIPTWKERVGYKL